MKGGKRKNIVLGLDMGTTSIKAVALALDGDALAVAACACREVAPDAPYSESLRGFLDAERLPARNVVIGISGRGTVLQTVSLPPGIDGNGGNGIDGGGIGAAVRAAAEKHIPYSLDEALLDGQVLDAASPDGGARVLLAAARRSDVENRLRALAAAGVVPVRVDAELVALANAAETANAGCLPHPEKEPAGLPVGLVDFGASKTLIAVTDGASHLFREFPVGGATLTEMIAQRFACGMDRAEELKRNPGDELDTVRDAMYPGLEDIATEIRVCLEQFRKLSCGREAKRLLLSGGLLAFGGVARLVGRMTRTEARVFDPLGAADPDGAGGELPDGGAHLFAVAFGLACHARCVPSLPEEGASR